MTRTFKLPHAGWQWTGTPIIAANMDTIGTFEMADALREFEVSTALHKHYSIDDLYSYLWLEHENKNKHVFYSMGITENDFDKLFHYFSMSAAPTMFCLDVANGYTNAFLDAVKRLRDFVPGAFIVAGNVVTPEKTEQVIQAGADMVKVGIGPGSVCTTRKMTGVGFPQLSAIIDCADAAHGLKGLVCADGGCKTPGDVAKAFGAGADFVMLGGMLAGHNECGGSVLPHQVHGKSYMAFYGMSSETAMNKHSGGVADYRAAEGKAVFVEYKGCVKDTVREILGGVRSTCTYVGAKEIKELSKRTTFIRVRRQLNDKFG